MITREQWRQFIDNPVVEWTMFALGILLIIARPDRRAAARPGRHLPDRARPRAGPQDQHVGQAPLVRVKRWQPKAGRWMDWALRRPSAQRREALRKARAKRGRAGELTCAAALHYRRARQRLPLGRPFFFTNLKA